MNLVKIFKAHPLWKDVKTICDTLNERGFQAWLAGGCVRDAALGVKPKDFDIATDAKPEQIQEIFPKTIEVGKAFGVIRVIVKNNQVEIATFRKDGPYSDSRRPDQIEYSNPQEDAARRDFTVNALFYDVKANIVNDFVDGLQDLDLAIIRAVGDPHKRFSEDKLRVLRAVRFVAQLGFKIENETRLAVIQHAPEVNLVSWERIQDEISKLFKSKYVSLGIQELFETRLVSVVFPELDIHYEEIKDYVAKVQRVKDHELFLWLIFFFHISKSHRVAAMKRLKLSNKMIEILQQTLELYDDLKGFDSLTVAEKKIASAHDYMKLALGFYENLGKPNPSFKKFILKNKRLPKPLISATELLEMGLKPGPQIGEILKKSFEAQLEGKIKTKAQAKKLAKS